MVAAPGVHLINRVLGRQQLKNLPIHILTGPGGLEAHISPLGGVIQRLIVPDREGNLEDVVLGFDDIEPYAVSFPYTEAAVSTCNCLPAVILHLTLCLLFTVIR